MGDVYQFSTLHDAIGEANVLFIATGSRPALDPFGPFTIDYEARALHYQCGYVYHVSQC